MQDAPLSILQILKRHHIADLILEEKLKNKGYTFNYIVDQDDLLKYCFPYGITGQLFDKKQIELDVDKLTAYYQFFSKISTNNPLFLLDEYIPEISKTKKIIIETKHHSTLFNYAKNFQQYLVEKEFHEKQNVRESIVNNDIILFIAIASGLLYDGITRFNYILNNENFLINYEDFEELSYQFRDELIDAFKFSSFRHEKITDTIISIYKKKNLYRPSKATDAQAIARMSLINHRLNKNNSKCLLLFLSSSPTSESIFEDFSSDIILEFEGQKFNFHRTVEQLFVSFLLDGLDSDDRLGQLANLERLIELREIYAEMSMEDIKDADFQDTRLLFIKHINKLRENYIAVNSSRQFDIVKNLISLVEQSDGNYAELRKMYNILKDNYAANINSQNLGNAYEILNNFLIDQLFIVVYGRVFKNLLSNEVDFYISRGQDYITGTAQHLPLLFKKINHISDKVTALVFEVSYFSEKDELTYKEIETLKNQLQSIVKNILIAKHKQRSIADNLGLCLLLLILPDAQLLEESNSEIVYDYLENQYKVLSDEVKRDADLYSDFLYMYISVARRITKYHDALSIVDHAINLFKDDGRFYHAKSLILYCLFEENKLILTYNEKIDSLSEMLVFIEAAKDLLYPTLLLKQNKYFQQQITTTLLNSSIYTKCLLYEITKHKLDSEQSLSNIRLLLSELKDKFSLQEDYLKFPEFLHTESFLEFFEFEFLSGKERLDKLNSALTSINLAIKLAEKMPGFNLKGYNVLKNLIEKTILQK